MQLIILEIEDLFYWLKINEQAKNEERKVRYATTWRLCKQFMIHGKLTAREQSAKRTQKLLVSDLIVTFRFSWKDDSEVQKTTKGKYLDLFKDMNLEPNQLVGSLKSIFGLSKICK